jgi:hypothetical protein
VFDGEAGLRPGVEDLRFWEIIVRQLLYPCPFHLPALAPTKERSAPSGNDVITESPYRADVSRYSVIGKVASDNLPEPFPRLGNRPMHPPSQAFGNSFKRRPHTVPSRLPSYQESASTGTTANENETQEGPDALGDLRRRNGASATILKPDLLDKLRLLLGGPPQDGGLWSSRKVANWMAGELGLASVAPQRGWEALKAIGWSIQTPRPKNPKSATPEEAAAFKKTSRTPPPRRLRSIPRNQSRYLRRMSTASA